MKTITIIGFLLLNLITYPSQAKFSALPDSIPSLVKTALNTMFDSYLKIENSLLSGDTEGAEKYAKDINNYIPSINKTGLNKFQLIIFNKQVGKILQNSHELLDQKKDFNHQCVYFDFLTDSFYVLLKNLNFNIVTIYYNYTPEGNQENSAHWLSTQSTMENPYFKGLKKIKDKQVEIISVVN